VEIFDDRDQRIMSIIEIMPIMPIMRSDPEPVDHPLHQEVSPEDQ